MLNRALPANTRSLQECVDRRALIVDREYIRYPHELARRVVEESLSETTRLDLHARVLHALAANAADATMLSRLVHHADAARDAPSVLRYAPLAGEEAARRGAHRQGAAFYRTALCYADGISLRDQAVLLEKLAWESGLSGRGEEALEANARAFEIWRGEGDTLAQGINRRTRFGMLLLGVSRRGRPRTSSRLSMLRSGRHWKPRPRARYSSAMPSLLWGARHKSSLLTSSAKSIDTPKSSARATSRFNDLRAERHRLRSSGACDLEAVLTCSVDAEVGAAEGFVVIARDRAGYGARTYADLMEIT